MEGLQIKLSPMAIALIQSSMYWSLQDRPAGIRSLFSSDYVEIIHIQ
jgi:hypothetical protein